MRGSPEWEAAVAGVEELETQLDVLEASGRGIAPTGNAGHAVLAFGPTRLADQQIVQGTFAGAGDALTSFCDEVSLLAERAAGRREFVRELETLATMRGFVLESNGGAWGAYVFYAWDRQSAEDSASGT